MLIKDKNRTNKIQHNYNTKLIIVDDAGSEMDKQGVKLLLDTTGAVYIGTFVGIVVNDRYE